MCSSTLNQVINCENISLWAKYGWLACMRNYSKKKRGKVFVFHEEQKLSSDTSKWYSKKHFM